MSPVIKNILTFGGIAVIASLAYYLYVVQGPQGVSLDSDTDVNEARLASEQFVRELAAIKNFDLSDDLFADPRFRSFVDFTTPVSQQPFGRSNPFEGTN